MSDDFEQIYLENGKDLNMLIQEWINENYDNLVRQCNSKELKYNQTDK